MANLEKQMSAFDNQGVIIVDEVVSEKIVNDLKFELAAALEEDQSRFPDVFDKQMVHNCMVRGSEMEKLISHPILNKYINELFTPFAIIYAYQSSSLFPGSGNYGSRVHVDCPRFIENYMTNLGVIIALDDFTKQNGATLYIPGSHKVPSIPTDDEFYSQAKQLVCKAGSIVFFNGRLVHAAGINSSKTVRHALTINYCRPYMRQRFDFPRLIPQSRLDKMDSLTKQRIGFDVRMPTNLNEFYLPAQERLYKPGQE